jgi:mRNA interferase RelE/StbE
VANYKVELKRSAAKEVAAVPNARARARIVARIGKLANDLRPAGCQKLSGEEAWRIRHGTYRIIDTIDGSRRTVTVVRVRHRSDVYR